MRGWGRGARVRAGAVLSLALVGLGWPGCTDRPSFAAPPADDPLPIDPTAARDEAVAVLAGYLAIDTTNPPGREAAGIAYLADRLTAEGIRSEVWDFLPGRPNLMARLKAANPTEPPLCLLSHVDVVNVEREAWAQEPFGGVVDAEGYLWGRGALDMKGVGVTQLLSMVWLKRLGMPLRRDVVLLVVGDEEVDNLGAQAVAERWADIGCSQLLNEGGIGVQGALVDGVDTFAVSYTEKGSLWLKMWAEGPPGHGSTPLPDSAPVRLMQALDRIRTWEDEPQWRPEMHMLLRAIGEKAGGVTGLVLKSPGLTRSLAAGKLLGHPLGRAALTNTLNVTGFGGHDAPNVVPSKVFAQLDLRLLPGERSAEVLAELKAKVADVPGISLEVLQDLPAVESPLDDSLYQAVVRRVQLEFPQAAVGPYIMAGTTDSQVLRPLGVHCYGFGPFMLPVEELRGMHGHNERIHRDVLGKGLELMTRLLVDVAVVEGGKPTTAWPVVP